MQNKSKEKSVGRVAIIFMIVLLIAFLTVVFLLRFGIEGEVIQKSGATIAGVWQNLFGGATYDINPGDDTILDNENASDTAVSVATGTVGSSTVDFEGDSAPAEVEKPSQKPSKKSSSSKKISKTATSSLNDINNDDASGSQESSDDFLAATIATSSNGTSSAGSESVSQIACSFPVPPFSTSTLSAKIIINEIAWMGSVSSTSESATAAANDEWMELKNSSTQDVELAGWSLLSNDGAIKIIFAAGDHISAGGFYLLARGTGGTVSARAQKTYSGGLSNAGAELALLDAQCGVSDFFDASSGWPGGNNTTKQTLERSLGHDGWQTSLSAGGTPGAENSTGAPAVQPATSSTQTTGSGGSVGTSGESDSTGEATTTDQTATSTDEASGTQTVFCPADHVVIEQIQIAGATSANDFVRLFNPSASSVDIGGWKLRKKSSGGTDASLKVLGKGSVIVPGGTFTWANSANGFAASVGADVSSTETIAADNSVAVMNASGTIVDEVAWGTGSNQYVEGNAFPTNPAANQMLERITVNGAMNDSDDNAADFALH